MRRLAVADCVRACGAGIRWSLIVGLTLLLALHGDAARAGNMICGSGEVGDDEECDDGNTAAPAVD